MNRLLIISILTFLSGCMPVKTSVLHQYKLEGYSQQNNTKHLNRSILISQPEAMAGYQTEQMLYIQKPYELSAFSENSWVGTPANMLYPLLIQTLQQSHAFSAVTSSPFADKVDYRLDTQILSMEQNFLTKPSIFELSVKAVLTRVMDNQVLASQLIRVKVPCKVDSPYGGVVAANQATVLLTQKIKTFILHHAN